jgi:signal transduction histidine kinase
MVTHRLLKKQVNRLLPEKYLEDEELQKFINTVNDSYLAFERDKQLSEHAFKISEQEFFEVNTRLNEQLETRSKLIQRIVDAIHLIDNNFEVRDINNVNLLDIANYLNGLIEKTKQTEKEILEAKNEADRANRAKSDFLSMISHEIRTPLNAIIGMTYLLMTDDPKPEQINHFGILKTSSDNLLSLINDILDLSKIESGNIELEAIPFSLEELSSKLLSTHSVKAKENNTTLAFAFDSNINENLVGDPLRFSQILNNLISNAIKFTKDGEVKLSIELAEHTPQYSELICAVSDNGIGIHPDKLQTIFESFSQESVSTSRKYGGTGLGLSITRKLLRLMNTDIEVKSEAGKGSTFYFRLKLNNHLELDSFEKDEIVDLSKCSFLVVDDTPTNFPMILNLLAKQGAKCETAESGEEALDLIKQKKFDLILLDLLMPEMDGFDVSEEILKNNPNQKIIAISASANSEMAVKVKEAGMLGLIPKPFEVQLFYKTITQTLIQ